LNWPMKAGLFAGLSLVCFLVVEIVAARRNNPLVHELSASICDSISPGQSERAVLAIARRHGVPAVRTDRGLDIRVSRVFSDGMTCTVRTKGGVVVDVFLLNDDD
jgi:hypothetical protein